jgi:hypothetical protein
LSKIDRRFGSTPGAAAGLQCTADGVFLSGVPLLQTTASGLAARPAEDIDALLKGAFGADLGAADLLSSLDVIAKALNAGDLGRAMVATLQARLPTLNAAGARRLAEAEARLAKYDQQELRDWRGRWATGDGPGSSSGPDPLVAALAGDHPNKNPFGLIVNPATGALSARSYTGFTSPIPTTPSPPTTVPATAAQKQRYIEWLVGAKQNYPSGVMSPEEVKARALLGPPKKAPKAPATPAEQLARYPHALDSYVEQVVAKHNESSGAKPGDPTYLDPNLVKAILMVESAHDRHAYAADPMQVNKPGDWDRRKATLGLQDGVAPNARLSIQAGVAWLDYKAYAYDGKGGKQFVGWPTAVQKYNKRGGTAYWPKVLKMLDLIESVK